MKGGLDTQGSRSPIAKPSSPTAVWWGLYAAIVRDVNSGLANFETIKRFRLVPDEWSQDSGELTPSMKLKRRVINAKYATEIAELYADEATSRAE